jgi:hypothetical protein
MEGCGFLREERRRTVLEFLILVLTLLAPTLAVADDILQIVLDCKKRQQHKDDENKDSEKSTDE